MAIKLLNAQFECIKNQVRIYQNLWPFLKTKVPTLASINALKKKNEISEAVNIFEKYLSEDAPQDEPDEPDKWLIEKCNTNGTQYATLLHRIRQEKLNKACDFLRQKYQNYISKEDEQEDLHIRNSIEVEQDAIEVEENSMEVEDSPTAAGPVLAGDSATLFSDGSIFVYFNEEKNCIGAGGKYCKILEPQYDNDDNNKIICVVYPVCKYASSDEDAMRRDPRSYEDVKVLPIDNVLALFS